jgi:hypothetical protein
MAGSVKMNGYCTCYLKVKNENGNYIVTYVNQHYGHEIEIEKLRMDAVDNQQITCRATDGISDRNILKEIRSNTSTKSKSNHCLSSITSISMFSFF